MIVLHWQFVPDFSRFLVVLRSWRHQKHFPPGAMYWGWGMLPIFLVCYCKWLLASCLFSRIIPLHAQMLLVKVCKTYFQHVCITSTVPVYVYTMLCLQTSSALLSFPIRTSALLCIGICIIFTAGLAMRIYHNLQKSISDDNGLQKCKVVIRQRIFNYQASGNGNSTDSSEKY